MKRCSIKVCVLILIIAVSLALTGCSENVEVTGRGMEIPEPPAEVLEAFDAEMANASNEFGFALFRNLVEDGQNTMISPTSIYTALAMTLNGARGDTFDAMAEVLGVPAVDLERFNANNLARLYLLQEADPEVTLNIANSLWVREGEELDPAFVERNQSHYDAMVQALNFDDPEAAATINAWVKDRTGGLIEDIVEPPIDAQTILFLVNAIYFQGDWTVPFNPDNTVKDVFHGPDGEINEVPFMYRSSEFRYAEKVGAFQAVRLPYGKDERLAMIVFLPAEGTSVVDVAMELDAASWNEWRWELRSREGQLWLPRFTMEYEKTLNQALEELGMDIAFDEGRADFFGMIPRDEGLRLFISEVKHKAFITVDEEGSEAAAATSVEIAVTSAPPTEPFQMKVDRPFIFLIHDQETNEVLFTGSVADPTQ
ncbi:MAG: serpin family protein [Bacillota bacterium]|nr:serpin family protein [Bacillota bacterium]